MGSFSVFIQSLKGISELGADSLRITQEGSQQVFKEGNCYPFQM